MRKKEEKKSKKRTKKKKTKRKEKTLTSMDLSVQPSYHYKRTDTLVQRYHHMLVRLSKEWPLLYDQFHIYIQHHVQQLCKQPMHHHLGWEREREIVCVGKRERVCERECERVCV